MILPPDFRLALDAGARRLDRGTVLMGGTPLRVMRFSPRVAAICDGLLAGASVEQAGSPQVAERLARRLLDTGMAHPRPSRVLHSPADVTVVIPVRDRKDGLARALASVGPVGKVIVVDDCSTDGSGDVARALGASVLRMERASGPGAARNAGIRAADTPLVAFLDSDCIPGQDWLEPLLAHLGDPIVGAVAPRIRGLRTTGSVLSRYQTARSPLDLGPLEGPVKPRSRVSYVSTAALLARRAALLDVGGFDETLQVGEDVDLVWRMGDAGWTVRYEPAALVAHEHPRSAERMLARHLVYGTSAAPLARRHPGKLTPLRISAGSLLVWALVAGRRPAAAMMVATGTTMLLPRKLRILRHPWRESLRIAGRSHLAAGAAITDAVMRTWLPLALLGAFRWAPTRRALVASVGASVLLDWHRRGPDLDPLRYGILRIADDGAYCLGVWMGCLRERTILPLLPDLTNRPGRRSRISGPDERP